MIRSDVDEPGLDFGGLVAGLMPAEVLQGLEAGGINGAQIAATVHSVTIRAWKLRLASDAWKRRITRDGDFAITGSVKRSAEGDSGLLVERVGDSFQIEVCVVRTAARETARAPNSYGDSRDRGIDRQLRAEFKLDASWSVT